MEHFDFPFKKYLGVKSISRKISDLFHIEIQIFKKEIIILKSDLVLQARKFKEYILKYVDREKYPNIIK